MEGSIDMEWNRYDSIGCYTHFVTFNFDLSHTFDFVFQGKMLKLLFLRNMGGGGGGGATHLE